MKITPEKLYQITQKVFIGNRDADSAAHRLEFVKHSFGRKMMKKFSDRAEVTKELFRRIAEEIEKE